MNKYIIKLLILVIMIIGIYNSSFAVEPVKQFIRDKNSHLAPPDVTYNPNTEEYEMPYIKTDSSGNQYIVATQTGVWVVGGGTITTIINTVTVVDERYKGYDSTGTYGAILSTGAILNTPTLTTNWSFYTEGGDAEEVFSKRSGILRVLEGIPENETPPIPLLNNTITIISLTPGATFNHKVAGGN